MVSKLTATVLVVLFVTVAWTESLAQDVAPLEAYGALPETSLVTLSPDGSMIASRVKAGGLDPIYVSSLAESSFVAGANAQEVNPRRLLFANGETLVLVAGKTYKDVFVRRAFDYSSAYALDLNEQKIRVLLRKVRRLYEYQSGLGRIVGRSPDGNTIYMPAYYDTGAQPIYSLFAVRLDRLAKDERQEVIGTLSTGL